MSYLIAKELHAERKSVTLEVEYGRRVHIDPLFNPMHMVVPPVSWSDYNIFLLILPLLAPASFSDRCFSRSVP
jgi:hypothetical protein